MPWKGFLSVKANPYTDAQAVTTMGVIARWLKVAFADGGNLEARRAMSFAAFTGGLSLNAGVVLGHSVAYTIANRTRLPHGTSCAMALPYTVAFNLPAAGRRLAAVAAQILEKPGTSGADLALWVRDLTRHLGLPLSLREIGLKTEDLGPMAEECATRYPRPTNPVPITPENLKIFYAQLYEGDVEGCLAAFKSTPAAAG